MSRILAQIVDDIVVVVQGTKDPDEADFRPTMPLYATKGIRGALVLTYGGALNARQRRDIANAHGNTEYRVAVLTESAAVRGVITALSWMGMKGSAFHPRAVREAIAYLGSRADPLLVETLLDRFSREVDMH